MASPLATVSLVPTRSTIRALNGDTTIMITANGQQPDAGLERRVPEHELQVLGEQEDAPNNAKKSS